MTLLLTECANFHICPVFALYFHMLIGKAGDGTKQSARMNKEIWIEFDLIITLWYSLDIKHYDMNTATILVIFRYQKSQHNSTYEGVCNILWYVPLFACWLHSTRDFLLPVSLRQVTARLALVCFYSQNQYRVVIPRFVCDQITHICIYR